MQNIQIYVKEMRGAYYVIGVAPGKDIYDLGSRENAQDAVCHALVYARLLGIAEQEVYFCGHTIPHMVALGAGFVDSITKNEGEDRHC
ncbi:hypothetical protein FE782_28620 [Paenibacillus antri]|uniref:Uncharacterized protein n=1 Tax=Paenibacillus antri TaxID=2582848 RepID=A0A5R9G745_9BACL|nr:hypothetical protein [Paenibacillus antri]TLS48824.1 hypothetical protein FE782_28620 [Paenibacillus antri]